MALTWLTATAATAQRDYFYRDSTVHPIGQTVYVAGKKALYKQTSGGLQLLKDFTQPADTALYIRDVDFVTAAKGYVLVGSAYIGGNTQLFKTTDGGNSWTTDTSFYSAAPYNSVNQVQVLNEQTICLFDGYYESAVLRSFDGGDTWTMWLNSLIAHYFQLHQCSNGAYYLIGMPGDAFPSYSFEVHDTLWAKNNVGSFWSGCHNNQPWCIRLYLGSNLREYDYLKAHSDTLTKLCGISTHINETQTHQAGLVYPNPFGNCFTMVGEAGTRYGIFNYTGFLILEGIMQNHTEVVKTESLPAGIYFLKSGHYTYKLNKLY